MGHHEDRGTWRGAGPALILLLTNRKDYTADWLVLELHRREADFARFNTEDWPTVVGLSWRSDGSGQLRFAARTVDSDEVGSVWYRRPVAPVMPVELDAERARWAAAEASEAMNGFWLTLHATWVNPPLAEAAASSKPEQLRRAQRQGLAVPETLITNDGVEAQEFAQGVPTICKPLSPGAVGADGVERVFFTRLLSADDVEALAELGPEPYLLQHRVPKQYDVRVTVIGEEVFPVAIHSQVFAETETDWRVGDATQLRHERIELPDQIGEACLALVENYGLSFGAIDLALDMDGRYVFFEINPSGQWAWIEEAADVPLRSCLASLLMESDVPRR